MPLPISPPLTNNDVSGIINITGSNLTPWFDSGQTKALLELLNRYTAEIMFPYVERTVLNDPDPLNMILTYNENANVLTMSYEEL